MRNHGQRVLNILPKFFTYFFTIQIMTICKSEFVPSESTSRDVSKFKIHSPTETEGNHEKPQYV
jgi:hypothetical protein